MDTHGECEVLIRRKGDDGVPYDEWVVKAAGDAFRLHGGAIMLTTRPRAGVQQGLAFHFPPLRFAALPPGMYVLWERGRANGDWLQSAFVDLLQNESWIHEKREGQVRATVGTNPWCLYGPIPTPPA